MDKLYKKFLVAFVIFLTFLPACLGFEFKTAQAAGNVCDVCCTHADCGGGSSLECQNFGVGCNMATKKNLGVCQVPGKITFCSLSEHKDLESLVNAITKWLLILALTIAPLMILLGGFFMLTSRGDPKTSTKGKEIIKWAVIGLAVILFAKAFTSIITSTLIGSSGSRFANSEAGQITMDPIPPIPPGPIG